MKVAYRLDNKQTLICEYSRKAYEEILTHFLNGNNVVFYTDRGRGIVIGIEILEEDDESERVRTSEYTCQRPKNLEVIAESELCNIKIKHPNGKIDFVHIGSEIEKRVRKIYEDYADELKAELKELGVEYENN